MSIVAAVEDGSVFEAVEDPKSHSYYYIDRCAKPASHLVPLSPTNTHLPRLVPHTQGHWTLHLDTTCWLLATGL